MTTIALPEQWSFGGISLSSYAYLVGPLTGADELPPLRGQDLPYAGIGGRRPMPKLHDSRQVSLPIIVAPTDASGITTGTNRQQARANLDALKLVLGRHAQDSLTRLMPDGSTRTARAECLALHDVTSHARGEVFGVIADFWLADPYFYGPDVVDASRVFSASPLNFTLTRLGNVRTSRSTIDILGPVTAPRVTNNTTSTWVQGPDVPAGQHLVIDTDAFTALLNGTSVIGSVAHSGDIPFLTFDPGANSLSVTGTGLTAAGRVTTTVKDPWL